MRRPNEPAPLTFREALAELNVEEIKPLLALAGRLEPGRKGDMIERLVAFVEKPKQLHALYEGLDDLAKNVVQEAVHDPEGVWHFQRFEAKYGGSPALGGSGRSRGDGKPSSLRLFFPDHRALPTDLRAALRAFVPAPPPLTVAVVDELPATIRPGVDSDGLRDADDEEVELRVRETARTALIDVKAVLRLVDAGAVKVGDKTRRPSRGALTAVAAVLSEGDFYTDEDRLDESDDPAANLVIQPFAWPMLLQAAGLAGTAEKKLALSPAGRRATTQPAHEIVRQIWSKWQKTTLLDEFNRIDAVKGQQSSGSLTAVAPRREAVVAGLKECPAGKWIRVEELFRLLRASAPGFEVARNEWKLYIGDPQYGNFSEGGRHIWECLQGRFTLALLFEYAATLGLVDVAYISPVDARTDYTDLWGAESSCLSRYDGLMYFRINPLGAWCLGLTSKYEPRTAPAERLLKVLANLDVVAADRSPSPADVLFLERFAERRSEAVWRLSRERILAAVEQGLAVAELKDFLASRVQGDLPQTAAVFLTDVQEKAGQLEDLGAARLIRCTDAVVAQTLAGDRRLRNLCQLAGERGLVFGAADEAAVRRALRELGYVLPPPK